MGDYCYDRVPRRVKHKNAVTYNIIVRGALIIESMKPAFPLVLSPMDDVTDMPFRALCREHGADVVVTEFIAAEGLTHDAAKSFRKMLFDESQRPVGIQIFGADEHSLLLCLDKVEQAKPDFIDINWGCPVRKVAGRGAGAGMLKNIPLLLHITESIVKHSHLPVTVKTRLGDDDANIVAPTLVEQLQDVGVTAVALHGRTRQQMYSGSANWELIARCKDNPRLLIPLYGNGDITAPQQVVDARDRYGVDGVLIGRAAIGNPWIFSQSKEALAALTPSPVSIAEKTATCLKHAIAATEFHGERTGMLIMRKHYGCYFKALPHFKPFRQQLVTITTIDELRTLLSKIEQTYTME